MGYNAGTLLKLQVAYLSNSLPWDTNPQSEVLCWKDIAVSIDDKGEVSLKTAFEYGCSFLDLDLKEDI